MQDELQADDPYLPPRSEQPPGLRHDGLTRKERYILNVYLDHRDRPFTLSELIPQNFPSLFLTFVFYALLSATFFWLFSHIPWLPWVGTALLIGMLAGATIQLIHNQQHVIKIWPILSDCIDWDQIKRKLAQDN